MQFKNDIFEPEARFKLEESKSEIDGSSVLAKVSGVFFVPDGTSRNKRFYPKSLWEKAIGNANIKEKLASRRMFGTIGHDQVINDMAILEGKVSHIVTGLSIDSEGKGIGEALVLDTPAGKALNTLLRAGCKLFVSSRATGKFNGEHKGMPVVDENTYDLNTFDFVIDPGFLEANPSLKESINEILGNSQDTFKQTGEDSMSVETKLADHITGENHKLKNDLQTAIAENDDLKGKLAVANSNLENIREENEEANGMKEALSKYETLGTVEELSTLKENFTKIETELKEYKEIDPDVGPTDIAAVVETAKALIEQYREIGTVEKVAEALKAMSARITAFEKFGDEKEVEDLFDLCNSFVSKEKNEKVQKEISALAKELNVEESKIAKVFGKFSVEEIKELFANTSSAPAPKTEVKVVDEKLKTLLTADKVVITEDENEDKPKDEKPFAFEMSLVERLMNKKM